MIWFKKTKPLLTFTFSRIFFFWFRGPHLEALSGYSKLSAEGAQGTRCAGDKTRAFRMQRTQSRSLSKLSGYFCFRISYSHFCSCCKSSDLFPQGCILILGTHCLSSTSLFTLSNVLVLQSLSRPFLKVIRIDLIFIFLEYVSPSFTWVFTHSFLVLPVCWLCEDAMLNYLLNNNYHIMKGWTVFIIWYGNSTVDVCICYKPGKIMLILGWKNQFTKIKVSQNR